MGANRILAPVLAAAFIAACGPATTEGLITVSFTVAELPTGVTVNQDAAETGEIEISWEAVFDTNGDQRVGEEDVALAYYHVKQDGAVERRAQIDALRPDVMVYLDGSTREQVGPAAVVVEEGVISLTVSTSVHEALTRINRWTWVHFEARSVDASADVVARDHWPAPGRHTVPAQTGSYRDRLGDASPPAIDLVRMGVSIQEGEKLAESWTPGESVAESAMQSAP